VLIPRSNLSIVGIPLRPRIFPASSPPPQPTRTTPTLNLHPSFATSSTAATPYHTTANLESQIRSRTATSLSQTFSTQLYQAEQNLAIVPTFDLEQRVRLETEVKILKASFEGFYGFEFRKKNSRLAKKEKKQKADLALCINLQAVVGLCQGFGAITTGGPTGDAGLADGFRGMQIGQGGGVMMTQDAQPGGYAQG
jgi:hypothetical protein